MSRVGKAAIAIPSGVTVAQKDKVITISGTKGTMKVDLLSPIKMVVKDNVVTFENGQFKNVETHAVWGLMRALVNNAIEGVSTGFVKELELVGIGYRVEKTGDGITLRVGYSHPVEVVAPDGITIEIEGNTAIKISGYDKQQVGQVAAKIRAIRKPEPYKGKGIRYKGEVVRRKPGKAAKTA